MKNRIVCWSLIIIMLFGVVACGKDGNEGTKAYQDLLLEPNEVTEELISSLKTAKYKKPKNIIYMIGDGMGYNALEAAQAHYKEQLYEGTLAMYQLPVQGKALTYSITNQITDSAAGGTALATGNKTGNRIVGMSSDKTKEFKNLLELADEKGKSTGVVVTTPVVDATPATFTAHVDDREAYTEIAAQQLEKFKSGTLDLILGGGRSYYECDENKELLESAKQAGVTYTNQWEETKDTKLPVVGLYAEESLDTMDEATPSLAEMTVYALNQLSRNEKGFFLMVEGAQIDDYAEANNLEMQLHEIYEFDCAVTAAMRYVAQNPDTVLIVTADHETGDVESTKDMSQTTYSTEQHTYKTVPILAAGYRTEELKGNHENTEIAAFVASLLGEKEFGGTSTTAVAKDYTGEGGKEISLDGTNIGFEFPMDEIEEATKELKGVKVLHITLENKTEELQRLPMLCFTYRAKEYQVEPQESYIKAGEVLIVDYTIPESVWGKDLISDISKVGLMTDQETATYVLKDIQVTSRVTFR